MSLEMFTSVELTSPAPVSTARAFAALGFTPLATSDGGMVLRQPGGVVRLRIERGDEHPPRSDRSVFYGLDVYTSNADLAFRVAREAAWDATPPVAYWASGRPIIESRLSRTEDGATVFVAQTDPELARHVAGR